MILMLILLMASISCAAGPVESAWIMSPRVVNEQLRKTLPDVHEVIVEDRYVEVRSAGLSLRYLGPFQNPLTGESGLRDLRFRIPRNPVAGGDGESQNVGPGVMGVFLNGVPLYNRFADASYLGRNMWHFDTIAYKDPTHPTSLGLLAPMISKTTSHSPLLGFAMDGFPIYGPWGFANSDGSGGLCRMHSGYRLRNIQARTRWPDGSELTPSQYGPPVDSQFPLGTFIEDYEYKPDAGDLDSSNGRFTVTPDYPQGTYAYFLTTDESSQLAFPYFLIDRFKGRVTANANPVHFGHGPLECGKPVELSFRFPESRWLEIVHEKPIHLMVVSSDLSIFEHIHPEWTLGNRFTIPHTFRRPGKYRLFAQFTRPGEPETTETFDVLVTGQTNLPAPPSKLPIAAKLSHPDVIRAGEDVAFTVELSGEPIEPYLGAWAHFVLLDKSLNNFIHAHPSDNTGASPAPNRPHIHGVSDMAAGPPPSCVRFSANFLQAGHYKLWAQFQVAGQPIAIPFDLEVSPGGKSRSIHQTIPASAILLTVDARGFTPARIETKSANHITLAITRSASPNCGSQIVFPTLGIKRDLPVGETTILELPAFKDDLTFACGMGMFRGMIVAVARD